MATGLRIASWLQAQPQVAKVLHPGLPDDPGHSIWSRDFHGASGLFGLVLKKTTKTITIAFSSLEGAAIMNNTFCLGIFLALVYGIGLEWTFTAETLSILFIEVCLCFFAFKKVQTMLDAWLVLSLFPISVALVAILENVVGLN